MVENVLASPQEFRKVILSKKELSAAFLIDVLDSLLHMLQY